MARSSWISGDYLEAGFPSPLKAISRRRRISASSRERVAGLAAAGTLMSSAPPAPSNTPPSAHSHLHRHQRYSPQVQAQEDRRQVLDEAVARRAGPHLRRRCRILGEDGARTSPRSRRDFQSRRRPGPSTVNIRYRSLLHSLRIWSFDRRIARALAIAPSSAVHATHDLGLATAKLHRRRSGRRPPGLECTINGIGERAGNCSLEEVVMILKTAPNIPLPHPASRTEHLFSPAAACPSLITFGPRQQAISGANAFPHEAASHQTAT